MARWWQSEMASAVKILYVHPTYPPTCPNNIDVKSPVKTQTLLRTEYHPKPTERRNFLWHGGGQSEMTRAGTPLHVHPTYPPTCPDNIDVKSPAKPQIRQKSLSLTLRGVWMVLSVVCLWTHQNKFELNFVFFFFFQSSIVRRLNF